MIIWTGYGFVVPVVVFLVALACNFGFDAALGKGYYESHWWTVGAALLGSAVLLFPFALWMQAREERGVVDKHTGEEFTIGRNNHSVFFIPLRFWIPLLVAIGVSLCLLELVD